MTLTLRSPWFSARLRTLVIAAAVAGASLIGVTTPAHAVAPDCTTVTPGWTASSGVYHVTTADQLYCIPDESLSAVYELGNTLDLSGIAWRPIGSLASPFTGSFDGGDFVISGLNMQGPQGDYLGLFGKVDDADTTDSQYPTITGVHLRDVNVNATEASSSAYNEYVGAIAGMAVGATISNITIDGTSVVSGEGKYIGGVAGQATNSVLDELEVAASVRNAGTGNTPNYGYRIGGIVGNLKGLPSAGKRAPAISDTSFTGAVSGYIDVGGIAGFADPDGGSSPRYISITRVTSAGTLSVTPGHLATSASRFGGIVGSMWDAEISHADSTMSISGKMTKVGGAFGEISNTEIVDSTASGDVNTTGVGQNCLAAGFLGVASGAYDNSLPIPNVSISRSTATGDVTCNMNIVAGFVAYATTSVGFTHDQASGDVLSSASFSASGYFGGFVGWARDDVDILASSASGNVVATGANSLGAGGFAGYISDTDVVLRNTSAAGAVTTAGTAAGGLVGQLDRSSNASASHVISNSYARGHVAARTDADAGGLVGAISSGSGGVTISESFWNVEDAGNQATNSAGTQLATAAEMKALTTYANAGWDIGDGWSAGKIWGICTEANAGYPFLTGIVASSACTGTAPPAGGGTGGSANLDPSTNPGSDESGNTSGSTSPNLTSTGDLRSAARVVLPRRIKNKGWTPLLKLPLTLSSGQLADVRITASPRTSRASIRGDARYVEIQQRGNVTGVWLSGARACSVKLVITAPANDDYTSFHQVKRYRTRITRS